MTTETLFLVKGSNTSFKQSSEDISDTNFELMFTLLSCMDYDFDMISFNPQVDIKQLCTSRNIFILTDNFVNLNKRMNAFCL